MGGFVRLSVEGKSLISSIEIGIQFGSTLNYLYDNRAILLIDRFPVMFVTIL